MVRIYNSRNSKDLIVKFHGVGNVGIYNSRNSKDLIVHDKDAEKQSNLQQ